MSWILCKGKIYFYYESNVTSVFLVYSVNFFIFVHMYSSHIIKKNSIWDLTPSPKSQRISQKCFAGIFVAHF